MNRGTSVAGTSMGVSAKTFCGPRAETQLIPDDLAPLGSTAAPAE